MGSHFALRENVCFHQLPNPRWPWVPTQEKGCWHPSRQFLGSDTQHAVPTPGTTSCCTQAEEWTPAKPPPSFSSLPWRRESAFWHIFHFSFSYKYKNGVSLGTQIEWAGDRGSPSDPPLARVIPFQSQWGRTEHFHTCKREAWCFWRSLETGNGLVWDMSRKEVSHSAYFRLRVQVFCSKQAALFAQTARWAPCCNIRPILSCQIWKEELSISQKTFPGYFSQLQVMLVSITKALNCNTCCD